jgi:hypothetical protein
MEKQINSKTGKPFSRQTIWRRNNPQAIARTRAYARNPEQLAKSSIRTLRNKERLRKVKLEYYHKNKERLNLLRKNRLDKNKVHSNYIANYYIELKPACEICGETEGLERHHWRYDKPLLVNTLCRTCHKIQHVKNFVRWNECKLEANKPTEVIA